MQLPERVIIGLIKYLCPSTWKTWKQVAQARILSVAAIWGVNQHIEDLFLHIPQSVYDSGFQITKSLEIVLLKLYIAGTEVSFNTLAIMQRNVIFLFFSCYRISFEFLFMLSTLYVILAHLSLWSCLLYHISYRMFFLLKMHPWDDLNDHCLYKSEQDLYLFSHTEIMA